MSQTEPEAARQPDQTQSTPPPAAPRVPAFGELMPSFRAASDRNPQFLSLSLGGRWMVLMFFGSLALPLGRAAHERILARRALFDDTHAQFYGVGMDPTDRSERGLKNSMPGLRYFWDFDTAVTRAYGLLTDVGFTPTAFLIDPNLRIAGVQPVRRLDVLLDQLQGHLEAEQRQPVDFGAPVLTVPRVLEPDFCQALIAYYNQIGGQSSGFMREIDGLTVPVKDDGTKRRRDVTIADDALRERMRISLAQRLLPMIRLAFWWQATRIERYIVAHYSAADSGFFTSHRDNTTGGTAHRRFAVSINLNDDFDGGDLRFPEFGRRTYRPPLGGATVFACGLLHEATPVTRGERYATLPFLYDESGARIREANSDKVELAPAAPA